MSEISKRIKLLRENLGLGQGLFAKAVGVKKSTIVAIELERQRVPENILEAMTKKWPQYTLWLMTGEITGVNNQIIPEMKNNIPFYFKWQRVET